jgi:hypothetical protein
MKGPTRRTHFNPTAWTAFWNSEYYASPAGKRAREQRVHVLDLHANKVYSDKLDDIHFQRDLGLAELPLEEAKRLVGGEVRVTIAAESGPREEVLNEDVLVCIEDLFTQAERGRAYKYLFEVIRKQRIDSVDERVGIAVFIAFQHFRTPENFERMVDRGKANGQSKLAVYEALFDVELWKGPFAADVRNLASRDWILHVADSHQFPLPDRPILRNDSLTRLWVTLSPCLLLEINAQQEGQGVTVKVNRTLHKSFMRHFQSLAIRRTVRHIIFHDKTVLEEWRERFEWREKVKVYQDAKSKRVDRL